MNHKTEVIPPGLYCYYSHEPINSKGIIKLNGLCKYWQRTSHGTVRCNFLNEECVIWDDEEEYNKALTYFGSEKKLNEIATLSLVFDQVKECGINED